MEAQRENGGASGVVIVNNRTVARLKPASRAELVAGRVRLGVDLGYGADKVRVEQSDPDNPALTMGGLPVLSVASADQNVGGKKKTRVKRARMVATDKVEEWARNLKAALRVPALTADDNGKIVPLGDTRTVRLGGAARGQIALLYPAQNVDVLVNGQTGVVTFSGKRVGRETVTLVREGASVPVTVAVEPYAAQVATPIPVTVTAAGIPQGITRNLARDAAMRAVEKTPGASVTLGEPQWEAGHKAYRVLVVATGSELLPVRKTVRVPVQNVRFPAFGAANLFYSNAPERVKQAGTLFTGQLEGADGTGATRLLYHHQNVGPTNLWFTAELVNESDEPCRVLFLGGDAGPERDTVWVGYRAGLGFVNELADKRGVVVPIPAHSRIALQSARLPRGTTISGLMQIRVLSGVAPYVRISALNYDDPRRISDTFAVFPWQGNLQKETPLSVHVYNEPTKKVAVKYEVGGRWTFVPIGRTPLTAASEVKQELQGNYGVFYDVDFSLENPTDTAAAARIVFEPSAGMAGGIFEVAGGKTITIPQTNMPSETEIAAYNLAPGEKKTVRVRTIPLSGSNYPANLIARP